MLTIREQIRQIAENEYGGESASDKVKCARLEMRIHCVVRDALAEQAERVARVLVTEVEDDAEDT